jgi:hypothetical protein
MLAEPSNKFKTWDYSGYYKTQNPKCGFSLDDLKQDSRRSGFVLDFPHSSLSLQTVELISMVREVMALRFVVPLHDMLVHHDLRDRFSKKK